MPDEARTFGMESLFRQFGIYSHVGQLYEPVDKSMLLYYREATDGQILEEGITEAGSMASFIAAGTSYATHGIDMLPFFIFYSMFGFQRIGDLIWAAADQRTRGFLLGATAGRTTLNGEGLQHEDGHSHVLASVVPNLLAYDPGLRLRAGGDHPRRHEADVHQPGGRLLLHHPLQRELPDAADAGRRGRGHPQGAVQVPAGARAEGRSAGATASGSISSAAARCCARRCGPRRSSPSATAWPPTSGARPATRSSAATPWRRSAGTCCIPTRSRASRYVVGLLEGDDHPIVAVTDYMKLVPEQIARWLPGRLYPLGTDGFGRSETREALRRFFEVDAECVVLAALYQLASWGRIDRAVVPAGHRASWVSTPRSSTRCELDRSNEVMKRRTPLQTRSLALLLPALALAEPAVYKVDADHSGVNFSIRHFVSNVSGRFRDFDGVIRTTSRTRRRAASSSPCGRRRSTPPTMTATSTCGPRISSRSRKYPTLSFTSTQVAAKDASTLEVTGNLTMHGVTRQITFPVQLLGTMQAPRARRPASRPPSPSTARSTGSTGTTSSTPAPCSATR